MREALRIVGTSTAARMHARERAAKTGHDFGYHYRLLMRGSSDEVVSAQLTDKDLLNQFKEVEKLNAEDKHLIKTFIDAFLTKRHIQNLAH